MSCLPVLEFVSVIYSLKEIAAKTVLSKHRRELKKLFEKRMVKHKNYFKGNDIIKSNYDFALKVLQALWFLIDNISFLRYILVRLKSTLFGVSYESGVATALFFYI